MCSLSWSRSGRKIVSASTDNTVCIWDVLSGECDHRFRWTVVGFLSSPIWKQQCTVASKLVTLFKLLWKHLKNFLIKWLLSALRTPPFSPYFCRGWGVNLGSLGFHLFPLSKAVPWTTRLLRPWIESIIFNSDQVSPFLLPILFVLVHNADKSPSSWRFASNLFRFPSPVLRVQYHPREEHEILVSPIRHAAVVVYLPEQPSSTTTATSTTTTQGAEHKLVPLDDEVISLMLRLKRLMNPNLIRPNIFLMQL